MLFMLKHNIGRVKKNMSGLRINLGGQRKKEKKMEKNEKRSKGKKKQKRAWKERRNSPTLALLFTDLDFHWLKMGLVSRSRNLPSETDKNAT